MSLGMREHSVTISVNMLSTYNKEFLTGILTIQYQIGNLLVHVIHS